MRAFNLFFINFFNCQKLNILVIMFHNNVQLSYNNMFKEKSLSTMGKIKILKNKIK